MFTIANEIKTSWKFSQETVDYKMWQTLKINENSITEIRNPLMSLMADRYNWKEN